MITFVVFLIGLLVFTIASLAMFAIYAEAFRDEAEHEHVRLPRWLHWIFEMTELEQHPPRGGTRPGGDEKDVPPRAG